MTPAADEFRLPEPGLERYSWFWDPLHCPRPVPALAGDTWQAFTATMGNDAVLVNGYVYLGMGAPRRVAPAAIDPPPALAFGEMWRSHSLPRVRAALAAIHGRDYESMDAPALAALLPGSLREAAAAFAYTMQPMFATMGPMQALLAFCAKHFGAEGDLLATTLLQGLENDSAATGSGLGELAAAAAARPAVAAALRAGCFEGLVSLDGGPEFVALLAVYLDEYGSGNHTWAEIHKPSWREEPAIPLRMIAAFLASEGGPAANQERARAQRAEARSAAGARLDPEAREQFRGLLEAMHDYVPVVEDRARWQLAAAGAVRSAALALGARLATAGALAERDDIFYLHTDESARLAAGELPEARAVVAERRITLDRAACLVPPASLGAPLPAGFNQDPMIARMFGFGAARPVTGNVVHGIGASRGIFRGRARVVLDLDDADRVEPGDVLVCPFTAPPWTPLFAIAGAVVTDVGGVLSHSAIAAREYAVPCVCGTGTATRAIPDGAVVTVDGAAGTVVIEG